MPNLVRVALWFSAFDPNYSYANDDDDGDDAMSSGGSSGGKGKASAADEMEDDAGWDDDIACVDGFAPFSLFRRSFCSFARFEQFLISRHCFSSVLLSNYSILKIFIPSVCFHFRH